MVLGSINMSAQFFNPYCNPYMGEVYWNTMENIIMNNNLMQMQAQTNALQVQYMNMVNANAAAATYNLMTNPFGSSNLVTRHGDVISSDEIQDYERRRIECSTCNGTGKIRREKPNYATRQMITVSEPCSDCHGMGYTSRLVRK